MYDLHSVHKYVRKVLCVNAHVYTLTWTEQFALIELYSIMSPYHSSQRKGSGWEGERGDRFRNNSGLVVIISPLK